MIAPPPSVVDSTEISYEDFLKVYDGTHTEWVQGQAVSMTPVTPRHQRIANFLAANFQVFCEVNGAGFVLSAPVQMRLASTGREPDVMVIASEHSERVTHGYVDGPADLVVEVISPESRSRDRGEKFCEYEQAGVREYWLLDPEREVAEFYGLSERGVYYPFQPDATGRVESRVFPGLWINVEWLWQEPLPPLLSVLRLWGIV